MTGIDEARTCSALSRELGEALIGTAPVARTWVAIEQPGPWGRDALTGSHLDPEVGTALQRWADGTGVKVVLVRRPGRHPDQQGRHAVLIAHAAPAASWLRLLTVDVPSAVLALDAAALATGVVPAAGITLPGGTALVCTNGRRDRCCAVRGRQLALELADTDPDLVWECSHLGGHRFAPTAAFLPSGAVYGHLDPASAREAWAAAEDGRLVRSGLRGRSWLTPQGQVADEAVRRSIGEAAIAALDVDEPEPLDPGRWAVAVRHRDGRAWTVQLAASAATPARPESCGKAAVQPRLWLVRDVLEA